MTVRLAILAYMVLCQAPCSAQQGNESSTEKARLSIPVLFTRNAGQWTDEVEFGISSGATVGAVMHDGLCYQTAPAREAEFHPGWMELPGIISAREARIRYNNPSRALWYEPSEKDTCVSRYYSRVGDGIQETVAKNYRSVTAHNVWKNIDIRYELGAGSIRQTILLRPGAHPTDIAFEIQGLSNDPSRIARQEANHHARSSSADTSKQGVVFTRDAEGQLRVTGLPSEIRCEEHLTTEFLTYFGGSTYDRTRALAVDDAGNIYITGVTQSADFPLARPTSNALHGKMDVFVSKFDPTARTLLYSTYYGGSGYEFAPSIACGRNGRLYLTGTTTSEDLPTSVNALMRSSVDDNIYRHDGFLASFNKDGLLLYSSYLSGHGDDAGFKVEADDMGYPYVISTIHYLGRRKGEYPFITSGAYRTIQSSDDEFVLSKFTVTCDSVLFCTFVFPDSAIIHPGSGGLGIQQFTLDHQGNAICQTGIVYGRDLLIAPGFQSKYGGLSDALVVTISSDGRSCLMSTYIGGSSSEVPTAIAVDGNNDIYVASSSVSPDFPVRLPCMANPYNTVNGGSYITKISSTGSLLFSSPVGMFLIDQLVIDSCGTMICFGIDSALTLVNPYPGSPRSVFQRNPFHQALVAIDPSYRLLLSSYHPLGDALGFGSLTPDQEGMWEWARGPFTAIDKNGYVTQFGDVRKDSIQTFNAWMPGCPNTFSPALYRWHLPLCGQEFLSCSVGAFDTVVVHRSMGRDISTTITMPLAVRNPDQLRSASEVTSEIALPAGLVLASASLPSRQPLAPMPLHPGEQRVVSWSIAASPGIARDTILPVNVFTTFRNTDWHAASPPSEIQCCTQIYVRIDTIAEMELACEVSAPDTLLESSDGRNNAPNPFSASTAVRNLGNVVLPIQSVHMYLDPPSSAYSLLAPADTVRTLSSLAHHAARRDEWPIVVKPRWYERRLALRFSARDNIGFEQTSCSRHIIVMPVFGLSCASTGPVSVVRYASTGQGPDSILVALTIENRFDTVRSGIDAEIDCSRSRNLMLAAGETGTRVGMQINPLFRKVLGWKLCTRATAPFAGIDTILFRYRTAENPEWHECELHIRIDVMRGEIVCAGSAVDSMTVSGTVLQPDPCHVRFTIANLGADESGGLTSRVAPSPEMLVLLDSAEQKVAGLAPKAQHVFSWRFHALTSAFDRTAEIVMIVADSIGNRVAECVHHLFLPGIQNNLSCAISSPDTIAYNLPSDTHTPDPFSASLTVNNHLDTAQQTIEAAIDLSTAPHLKLSAGESAAKLIASIAAHASQQVDWSLTIASTPSSTITERVALRYRHLGDTAWKQCERDIVIEGGESVYAASCSTLGHDTVWADVHYESIIPRPVQLQYTITNTGNVPLGGCSAAIVHSAMYTLVNAADSMQNYPTILPGASASREWLLEVNPDRATPSVETIRWVWNCDKITSPKDCTHDITMLAASPNAVVYSPWLLRFEAERDAALPSAKEVRLWTGGAAKMPWQLGSSTAWLGYQPASGVDSARIAVAPATTALSPGSYSGRIDITAVPGVSPVGIVVLYEITTKTGMNDIPAPATSMLGQNYPNPAIGYTTIPLSLPARGAVQLALYDVYGRRVALLHEGVLEAGQSSLRFDASALAEGMYFVKLVGTGGIETRVMVVGR